MKNKRYITKKQIAAMDTLTLRMVVKRLQEAWDDPTSIWRKVVLSGGMQAVLPPSIEAIR